MEVSRAMTDQQKAADVEGVGSSDLLCGCRQCLRDRKDGMTLGGVFWPTELLRMVVCAKCGNKRCPHANNHLNECTNSNEPGQPGSAYA